MIPNQRIRIVSATPIEVAGRRLLPSVLTNTVELNTDQPPCTFSLAILRPISFVEEGPEGARWHAIPNTTVNILSTMAVIGISVAALGVLVWILRWLRG